MRVTLSGKTFEAVFALGENDVLLGRGTGPNENLGNVRFRSLVSKVLENAASNRSSEYQKMTKEKLAHIVFECIKKRQGRFVRKLTKGEISVMGIEHLKSPSSSSSKKKGSKEAYIIVPDQTAMEKTKQSFRHQLRVSQESHQQLYAASSSVLKSDDADDEQIIATRTTTRDLPSEASAKQRSNPIIRSSKFQEALASRKASPGSSSSRISSNSNKSSLGSLLLGHPPSGGLMLNNHQVNLLGLPALNLSTVIRERQMQYIAALENQRRIESLALLLRMNKKN